MENHGQAKDATKLAEQKYNKSAVIGLVLSIISVFGVGLAGIAGFILGIVVLTPTKHNPKKTKGKNTNDKSKSI